MNPLKKLKIDSERYRIDQSLGVGFFSYLRLFCVVDFWPVFWFRMMEYCAYGNTSFFKKILKLFFVVLRPVAEGMSGARIMVGANIGPGLLLHQSVGVIICAEAVIGSNCTLYAGACLVHRADGRGLGAPNLGDNVSVAIGSVVLGPVFIGNRVIVGAHSLVINNVESGKTVVGTPARPIGN